MFSNTLCPIECWALSGIRQFLPVHAKQVIDRILVPLLRRFFPTFNFKITSSLGRLSYAISIGRQHICKSAKTNARTDLCMTWAYDASLKWRHNERHGVSKHRHLNCLLSCLFSRTSKEIWKLPCHWPLCGESTGERRIPHTKGQSRRKCLHLMTSSWWCRHVRSNIEGVTLKSKWPSEIKMAVYHFVCTRDMLTTHVKARVCILTTCPLPVTTSFLSLDRVHKVYSVWLYLCIYVTTEMAKIWGVAYWI